MFEEWAEQDLNLRTDRGTGLQPAAFNQTLLSTRVPLAVFKD